MWEAIARNRRRSWLLIALMGVLLIALGAVIGALVVPTVGSYYQGPRRPGIDPATAGMYGAGVALLVWLIMWLVAVGSGDRVLLSAAGARRIEKEHAPQLWNIVEEMTIASGLGQMPKVYVIDDPAPNAFAVGYKPGRAAVAVTSGLLKQLDRDELQGVIAHEIGHIRNLDVKFMTMAAVMVGTIVLISDVFLRSLWYGGGRRRSSSRGGGQAQIIFLLIGIVVAILAPLCAQLLYLACSRRREYLADASSARYTRYPEGLASALERIGKGVGKTEGRKVSRVVAPMYIVNPLQHRAAFSLSATHPPIEKRVRILRSMGGRAGFADYENAFRQVVGTRARCLDTRTLEADTSVAAREPSAKPDARADAIARARDVGDLLTGLAGFVFIGCPCGVRLKVPPNFKRPALTCPRCGRQHEVPTAEAAAPESGKSRKGAAPPLRFTRRGTGWESFKCSCGHTVQLSPAFSARFTHCAKCNRQIEIVTPGG